MTSLVRAVTGSDGAVTRATAAAGGSGSDEEAGGEGDDDGSDDSDGGGDGTGGASGGASGGGGGGGGAPGEAGWAFPALMDSAPPMPLPRPATATSFVVRGLWVRNAVSTHVRNANGPPPLPQAPGELESQLLSVSVSGYEYMLQALHAHACTAARASRVACLPHTAPDGACRPGARRAARGTLASRSRCSSRAPLCNALCTMHYGMHYVSGAARARRAVLGPM